MTKHHLKVELALKPLAHGETEATVTVTTTDSCYHAGELKAEWPPRTSGIPEVQPLSFFFTHEGEICGQIVRNVAKSIKLRLSSDKQRVVAFAVVNGEVAGEASKPAHSE